MTRNQAVAHARMYADKWLIQGQIESSLVKIRRAFPQCRQLCEEMLFHCGQLHDLISQHEADTIRPFVTPRRK